MHICNKHTYFLTQLRRQGLPLTQLKCAFDPIILPRVWCLVFGMLERLSQCHRNRNLSATETECLQQLLVNAKRWNIVSRIYNVDILFLQLIVIKLFRLSLYSKHCFHHLFPGKQEHTHAKTLRQHRHNFSSLPFLSINLRGTHYKRITI